MHQKGIYWDSSQSLLPSKKMSHLPSQLAFLSRFDDVFLFPFSEDMLARSLEGKYLYSLEKKQDPWNLRIALATYSNPKTNTSVDLSPTSSEALCYRRHAQLSNLHRWFGAVTSPRCDPGDVGFCCQDFFLGDITISVTKSRRKNTWDMFTIDFLFMHGPLCLKSVWLFVVGGMIKLPLVGEMGPSPVETCHDGRKSPYKEGCVFIYGNTAIILCMW